MSADAAGTGETGATDATEDLPAARERWHEHRVATVCAPCGPLALTGTFWLADYPEGRIPAVPGSWRAAAGGVTLTAGPEDGITLDGEPLTGAAALTADGAPPSHSRLGVGGMRLAVIRREGERAVSLFDPAAPGRAPFAGIEATPYDLAYVVPGRFTPYGEERTVQVENVDGRARGLGPGAEPGFESAGTMHARRVAVEEEDGSLRAAVGDCTGGRSGYRFRFPGPGIPAADGSVTVDLNRGRLPPSALGDHFLCPFLPPGNTLPFEIAAGERRLKGALASGIRHQETPVSVSRGLSGARPTAFRPPCPRPPSTGSGTTPPRRASDPHSGGRQVTIKRIIRSRLFAVATGMAAVAALAAPTAAHADGGFSADRLASAGASVLRADVAGTAWHTDPATGTLVVTADSTVSAASIARIRSEAGANAAALRIERTPGKLTKLLSGGDAKYATSWRCSVGFNVRSGSTYYVLTAGHCTDGAGTWWTNSARTTVIGATVGSSFPNNDYGLVRYDNTSLAHPGTVGNQDITSAVNATNGMSVTRRGSTTGTHSGTVTGLNATVNYGGGDIVYGMIRTNVCAEPGDSGGPLYSGTRAVGLTSGGSGNCSSGGTTFFQPVVEALNAYGVSVY